MVGKQQQEKQRERERERKQIKPCTLEREKWRKKSFGALGNSLIGGVGGGVGTGWGRTSEPQKRTVATGAQKAKQREFTTEIAAHQHFPGKRRSAHPLPRWGLNAEALALEV